MKPRTIIAVEWSRDGGETWRRYSSDYTTHEEARLDAMRGFTGDTALVQVVTYTETRSEEIKR
jgi:hypothetical protein